MDRAVGQQPPEGARGALQLTISRLRRVLGEVIVNCSAPRAPSGGRRPTADRSGCRPAPPGRRQGQQGKQRPRARPAYVRRPARVIAHLHGAKQLDPHPPASDRRPARTDRPRAGMPHIVRRACPNALLRQDRAGDQRDCSGARPVTAGERSVSAGTHREVAGEPAATPPRSHDVSRPHRPGPQGHRPYPNPVQHAAGLTAGTLAAVALTWALYAIQPGASLLSAQVQTGIFLGLLLLTSCSRRAKVLLARIMQRFIPEPAVPAAVRDRPQPARTGDPGNPGARFRQDPQGPGRQRP